MAWLEWTGEWIRLFIAELYQLGSAGLITARYSYAMLDVLRLFRLLGLDRVELEPHWTPFAYNCLGFAEIGFGELETIGCAWLHRVQLS